MPINRLLIANRGEIAVRISRAAADLGITTVAVYSDDDTQSLHRFCVDESVPLNAAGARAYLDIEAVVSAAEQAGCDAIHPGYGFLAENPAFAEAIERAGITFVGPRSETLSLFGDKAAARCAAIDADVPVIKGTSEPISVQDAIELQAAWNGKAMILKANAGGGGRGSRIVQSGDDVEQAFLRAQSEATAAFGNGDLYAEELVSDARHIEVQIIGDATGAITHVGERECSTQRRHQKVIEVAPAPHLDPGLRDEIVDAAVRFASQTGYVSLGTFEFLVYGDTFAYIETNARLQVEHTVSEEVSGIDLVQTQLLLAGGSTLEDLGLAPAGSASGVCGPGQGQYGKNGCRWQRAPIKRNAFRVRRAERSGSSNRRFWLHRIRYINEL